MSCTEGTGLVLTVKLGVPTGYEADEPPLGILCDWSDESDALVAAPASRRAPNG